MIHDIILLMLDPSSVNNISINKYLVGILKCFMFLSYLSILFVCDFSRHVFFFYPQNQHVSEDFFHPSETQILEEILKCAEIHQSIRAFIIKHSVTTLYLAALAQSLDVALNPFRNRMLVLERDHIKNGNLPINYFLTEIKEFQTFFHFLEQFINEVKSQKVHGCGILSLLHKYNHHADLKSMQALKTIRLGVYAVFLRQLTQWLIYGRLVDAFGEFFIIHNSCSKNSDVMATTTNTLLSEGTSNKSELWKFQISYGMIPSNFTTSWAENVLFIGQTVRMLVDDPRKTVKKNSIWNDEDEIAVEFGSLWNKQEHTFFNKIQKLYNCNSIDNGSYEHVVNEIKTFVTERLSEIAFNQADLIKHLRFFRDYYLLGRGELFLEFIMQLSIVEMRGNFTVNLAREVNQAFQKALSRTSVDMDNITAYLLVEDDIDFPDSDDNMQAILNGIRLNFHVRWPLHLFFSPRVLHQYNLLFVFLLQIRQLQNGLHTVWRLHRDIKIAGNSMISQLRNKMLFLIDNLQYYLQVDVIESQFCTLIGAVQNSKDFEFIQRAHNIFQANVMCLSFLLNTGSSESSDETSDIISEVDKPENPVRKILNKIFKTIRSFCNLNESIEEQKLSAETQQVVNIFEEQ